MTDMVMVKIRTMMQRPGYRYIFIGGSVYTLELLVIVLAQHFGAGSVESVAISYWVGFVVSFTLQKLVTFRDKRLHHRVIVPQLVAYGLLILFNFGFTILVSKALSSHLPAVLIRTVALGITTIWNFYLYKTRIFKDDSEMLF